MASRREVQGSVPLAFLPGFRQRPRFLQYKIVTTRYCFEMCLRCPSLSCIEIWTALHCRALACIAIHCFLPGVSVLHCPVLYCTVLQCSPGTVLHCTALPCTVLHCSKLFCRVLLCSCTVLHCPAPPSTVQPVLQCYFNWERLMALTHHRLSFDNTVRESIIRGMA